jgi:hypothetical protein
MHRQPAALDGERQARAVLCGASLVLEQKRAVGLARRGCGDPALARRYWRSPRYDAQLSRDRRRGEARRISCVALKFRELGPGKLSGSLACLLLVHLHGDRGAAAIVIPVEILAGPAVREANFIAAAPGTASCLMMRMRSAMPHDSAVASARRLSIPWGEERGETTARRGWMSRPLRCPWRRHIGSRRTRER